MAIFQAFKETVYAARDSVGRAVGLVATVAQVVKRSAAAGPLSRAATRALSMMPRASSTVSIIDQEKFTSMRVINRLKHV